MRGLDFIANHRVAAGTLEHFDVVLEAAPDQHRSINALIADRLGDLRGDEVVADKDHH